MIKQSTLDALVAKGITAETPEQDIKKAYFGTAGHPLSKAKLPELLKALAGDTSVIEATPAAGDTTQPVKVKAVKEKKAKAPKEPAAPKAVKTAETPADAMARLKTDPKTAARWARVTEVNEMGKKGPTRVTILCDDKGPNGEDLFRQIAVQDLFQVRFSAGHKRARTKAKAAAPAAEQETAGATA